LPLRVFAPEVVSRGAKLPHKASGWIVEPDKIVAVHDVAWPIANTGAILAKQGVGQYLTIDNKLRRISVNGAVSRNQM
jgi:hypothetical protein